MNLDFGLTHSDLHAIKQVLAKYPQIEQAIIFGSRAKGNYKSGSDVDIALKGAHLTSQLINRVSFELNEETTMPYHFDVLNFHVLSEPALIEHIERVGKVLYENA
jgi:predicted nucleotidyltransferase